MMKPSRPAEVQEKAEWRLLQLLCDAELEPALRAQLCAKLTPEHFTEITHRIIFEEIRVVSAAGHPVSARHLREHLPGRVTARGFPDLEFASLFAANCRDREEAAPRAQCACEILARTGEEPS